MAKGLISEILGIKRFKLTFEEKDVVPIEILQNDWNRAMADVVGRLGAKKIFGKISTVLLNQLTRHALQIGEKFGDEIHFYHLPSILDMLDYHDKGKKVNVRQFKKEPLSKLMHLHHNQSTFIQQNVVNYWVSKVKESGLAEEDYQEKLLNTLYQEFLTKYPMDIAYPKAIISLLNKIHMEASFKNSENRTGEWIVFAKKNGINYYLCLATHKEAKKYKDTVIIDRIRPCLDEFPELREEFMLP